LALTYQDWVNQLNYWFQNQLFAFFKSHLLLLAL
jgi:hypothetical protein